MKKEIFNVVANDNKTYKLRVASHKLTNKGEEIVGKIGKNTYTYVYREVFDRVYFFTTDEGAPLKFSLLAVKG
jgi:hypothetical protein